MLQATCQQKFNERSLHKIKRTHFKNAVHLSLTGSSAGQELLHGDKNCSGFFFHVDESIFTDESF